MAETVHGTGKKLQEPMTIIGHSRLVTDGSRYDQGNNQPVLAGDCVGIHNGIIVNNEEIWKEQSDLRRQYQVDSEVILALLRKFLREQGSIIKAAQKIFTAIQGSASIAVLFRDFDRMLLGTNNGSLYYTSIAPLKALIFASEKYILDRLLVKHVPKHAKDACVKKIEPGRGCLIDLQSITALDFNLIDSDQTGSSAFDPKSGVVRTIVELQGTLPKNYSDRGASKSLAGGLRLTLKLFSGSK